MEVGRAERLQGLDFQRRSPRPFLSPSEIFPRPINRPILSLASNYDPHLTLEISLPRQALALHLGSPPLPRGQPSSPQAQERQRVEREEKETYSKRVGDVDRLAVILT